jgi:hypothetical protein
MDLEQLIEHAPKFHRTGGGEPVSYGLAPEVLRYMAAKIGPGAKTLETGSGVSTVVFALRGTSHVCITPAAAETERIVEYCTGCGIALNAVKFIVDRSEIALPGLEVDGLDLVLIDGNHAFPAPFIDYYYAAERMKVGGLLIVDDTQLWTGRVLRDFLSLEPEWKLDWEFSRRTAAFIKTKEDGHRKWWGAQPFVQTRSARYLWEWRIWNQVREYARRIGLVAR